MIFFINLIINFS